MDLQSLARQARLVLLLGAIPLGTLMTTCSARALELNIEPDNPKQGETISVRIRTEQDAERPQVTSSNTTSSNTEGSHPAFQLGPKRYRALVPTSPLDASGRLELRVTSGSNTKTVAVWLRDHSFPTQRINLAGGGPEPTQTELDRIEAFKQNVTQKKFWDGQFKRPNPGSVSTVYGVRRYYNGDFAEDYYHGGVDYAASRGAAVVAPAAGRIGLVGRAEGKFRLNGNTVGINHGQGVQSIFLHLNSIAVEQGQFVEAGERIGTVGSTGASTGPHLHWGLYVHGVAVDPVPWRHQGIR